MSITVRAPVALKGKSVELVARLNDIEVEPATTAKVIINERTGTIVAGGDVTPRELTSILQALRAAGALRAEIVVQ